MQTLVQITERHISTYRAIRDYIYHNRKSPNVLIIGDLCGIHSDQEVIEVLTDLKQLGYLSFDNLKDKKIYLAN